MPFGTAPSQIMNQFMAALQARQKKQDEELKRRQQQESIQRMLKSLNIPAPQGNIEPSLVNPYIDTYTQNQTRITEENRKAQEKATKESEKQQNIMNKKQGLLRLRPELADEINNVGSLEELDYIEKIGLKVEKEKETQAEHKWWLEQQNKPTRPSGTPPKEPAYTSSVDSMIDEVLVKEFYPKVPQEVKTGEYGTIDFAKPANIYNHLTPEDKIKYNTRKSELVKQWQSGGGASLYQQGTPPQEIQSQQPYIVERNVGTDKTTGKPVHKYSDGTYRTE